MNRAVKDQWLAALRSGKYKQGTGRLRAEDGGYCCLGVLCDLAVKAGVINGPLYMKTDDDVRVCSIEWYYDEEYMYPSKRVLDWAGLEDKDPFVTVPSEDDEDEDDEEQRVQLSELNDDWWTFDFARIADVIEAQL